MADKPRIVADDGINRVERVDQRTPPEEYPGWVRQGWGGFEHLVRGPEQTWKEVAARHPLTKAGSSNPLSLAAYAHKIVSNIDRLRRLLRDAPEDEGIITLALQVGGWIQDGFWRFNRGAFVRSGVKKRTHSRTAGRQSGATRRERKLKRRAAVKALAETVRRTHPYHRQTYPTRKLAQTITNKLQLNRETVRADLRALDIK